MKKTTALLTAALLLCIGNTAMAAYSTDIAMTSNSSIVTIINPVDIPDSRTIITIINPVDDLRDKNIITVINPVDYMEDKNIVTVINPMDFSFTQLSYSEGFFFDTSDTFGSGGSRMATIGSSSIRAMSSYMPKTPDIVTVINPISDPRIITVINPAEATTVPVPPALFLMGSGLAGLAGIRRKRQS